MDISGTAITTAGDGSNGVTLYVDSTALSGVD